MYLSIFLFLPSLNIRISLWYKQTFVGPASAIFIFLFFLLHTFCCFCTASSCSLLVLYALREPITTAFEQYSGGFSPVAQDPKNPPAADVFSTNSTPSSVVASLSVTLNQVDPYTIVAHKNSVCLP